MIENMAGIKNNPGGYYYYDRARRSAVAILQAVIAANIQDPTFVERLGEAIPEGEYREHFYDWIKGYHQPETSIVDTDRLGRDVFAMGRYLDNLDFVDQPAPKTFDSGIENASPETVRVILQNARFTVSVDLGQDSPRPVPESGFAHVSPETAKSILEKSQTTKVFLELGADH